MIRRSEGDVAKEKNWKKNFRGGKNFSTLEGGRWVGVRVLSEAYLKSLRWSESVVLMEQT